MSSENSNLHLKVILFYHLNHLLRTKLPLLLINFGVKKLRMLLWGLEKHDNDALLP